MMHWQLYAANQGLITQQTWVCGTGNVRITSGSGVKKKTVESCIVMSEGVKIEMEQIHLQKL